VDLAIYSRWRNPDGIWSAEQRIGGVLNGSLITTATIPGTNVLQLFYRATDATIHSFWRNPDGTWSAEQRIGGNAGGDPVAHVVPGTNILRLFYVGTGNAIYSLWRNPENETWPLPEQRIGGGNAVPGRPGIAVVPGTNILQLFYIGTDGAIYSLWRNPDGTWSSPEQRLGRKINGNVIAVVH
jgi:hypothetical protein